MKDSGVEWIGEIPADWRVRRIKELFAEVNERCDNGADYTLLSVSEYYGVAPKAEKISEDDMLTHAESLDGYKICHPNDIVMNIMLAWKRALGASKYEGIISPAYCVYRPKEGVNSRYFHYLYRTDVYANLFKQYSTGIIDSRLRLYPDKFLALKCQVPPIDVQKRIVDFLDAKCTKIDTVIVRQQEAIEKLKAYKLSVITEAVTKGLNPDVPMKDSGVEWIGLIPKHWELRKLKALALIISKGTTPSTVGGEIQSTGDIRFLKAENIQNNTVVLDPEFYIDEETNEILKRSKLIEDDILFVIAGATIGKTAIVTEDALPANTNQAVSFIRLKDSKECRFVWYFLQSDYVIKNLSLLSVHSAQPNLSMEDLGNFLLCYPEENEREAIVEYLDSKCKRIDEIIEQKKRILERLVEYKKSLIYEVVTGKREVV